jgi:hypothetical protein
LVVGIFQIREWIVVPGTIRYTQDCGPHFGPHDTRIHYTLGTIIFLVLEGRELGRKGHSKRERERRRERGRKREREGERAFHDNFSKSKRHPFVYLLYDRA